MAHSLHTTKRKFHKLLDSLTNNNNNSTSLSLSRQTNNASSATLPSQFEPRPKKQRVDRPTSSGQPPSTSRRWAEAKTGNRPMGDRERQPNFTPWDRAQFLERLKTFRHVDKWSSKPEAVNEVQWAKRGWTCVGKERVGCLGGCGREVVVKFEKEGQAHQDSKEPEDAESPEDWDAAVDKELTERYAQMVVTGHDVYCLWRKRGCDDSIYRLPFANTSSAIAELRRRYESLAAMQSEIPTSVATPSAFDIAPISRLLSNNFFGTATESSQPQEPNLQALSLALFGWQAEAGHIRGLMTCEACFRRVGLWLFKARKNSSASIVAEGDVEEAAMTRLDVSDEHRYYCPWINAAAQNGTNTPHKVNTSIPDLAGWELLLRALKITQHLHSDHVKPAASTPEVENPGHDAASDAVSTISTVETLQTENRGVRDAKDKERWAKLKTLRKMFDVKVKKTPKVKTGEKEGDVVSEKRISPAGGMPAVNAAG